jgi:4-amino-4-deoxy-L-arabinose transferase-like glycosyltransferase
MRAGNDPWSAESPKISRRAGVLILMALLAVFLLFLFCRGLLEPDEGRYTEIPREMVGSGNWMEMRLMGFRYYEKPPLTYWITAVPLQLFGAKVWATRIPLLPAALATGLLGFLIATKAWGRKLGMLAAVAAVSAAGLFVSMSVVIPDSYLTLWFAATCVLLFSAFADDAGAAKRRLCLLAAAFFVFLGTMTKGAVAAILPAAITVLWLLWERRLRSLWSLASVVAALLFLALIVAATWVLEQHNPGFTRYFYVEEHLSRFVGSRREQLHPQPFWFYLAVVPLLLMPWSLFLFRAIRTMRVKKALSADRLSRFLLVWAVVVIGFFSASTGKLMSYVVPAMLPLGLLIGRWGVAEPLDGSDVDRRLWLIGYALLPVCSALIVVVWLVSYFGCFPSALVKPDAISLLPLLPALVIALVLRTKGFPTLAGTGTLLVAFYVGLAFLISPLAGQDVNVRLYKNSAMIFKTLADQLRPGDRVAMMYRYRPSAAFYTQRIPVLYSFMNEMSYGIENEPERPGYVTNRLELASGMTAGGRLFGIIKQNDMKKLVVDGFSTNVPVIAEDLQLKIIELPVGQPAP